MRGSPRLLVRPHVLIGPLGLTGTWLHGEAVSAGIVMAADLSHRCGWVGADVVERTRALLVAAHLPIEPPKVCTLCRLCSKLQSQGVNIDGVTMAGVEGSPSMENVWNRPQPFQVGRRKAGAVPLGCRIPVPRARRLT